MKRTTIALQISFAILLAGCTSTREHQNFVASMPQDRVCALRFGQWNFLDDPTYPYPIAINPVIYFETSEEEDLLRIIPLVRQLRHKEPYEFIPMCGHLTQIALLDRNSRWLGEVSVNACSDDISLVDDPLRPRKRVHAYSYELSLEAFRLMKEHVPDLTEQMVQANDSVRVRFLAAVSNQPNNRDQRKYDPERAKD